MRSNIEWMMSFIPTIIGTLILIMAMMGTNTPLLSGTLRVIALSSAPSNFFRNQFEMLKYIAGP
ncbi:MAG: hypothetical protein GOU98_02015 [Candidatus Altiarchaeota archaeon]|nr:hypothetical protein [Candidatus Altiarchaeota archaeon]